MTFEVTVPMDTVCDEDSLQKEFKGNIHEVATLLYEQEGHWWDENMNLVKTEII